MSQARLMPVTQGKGRLEMDEKLIEAVKRASEEGKLSCPQAMDIAKEFGCDFSEIGRVANEAKVKIVGCQLGCF